MFTKLGIAAGIAALALVATSCSSPGTAEKPSSSPSADALPSVESPRTFDGEQVPVGLDAYFKRGGDVVSRYVLADDRAYGFTGSGVGAVDLATGKTLWTTPFPAEPQTDHRDSPLDDGKDDDTDLPVLSADGKQVYVATIVHAAAGDATAVQVLAVDTKTGHAAWHANVPLKTEHATDSYEFRARLVGVDDGTVVVSVPGGDTKTGVTAGIDAHTHKVAWTTDAVAEILSHGVAVSVANVHRDSWPVLAGIGLADGKPRWSHGRGREDSVKGVVAVESPSAGLIVSPDYADPQNEIDVLDPETGKSTKAMRGRLADPRITGDILVDRDAGMRGIDTGTWKTRWKVPTGSRLLDDPIAYHGLVYGNRNGAGAAIDADTGKDVTTKIPGTLLNVNEHGALVLEGDQVSFVRAGG